MGAPNFVAGRGAGRCILGASEDTPGKLGPGSTPAVPKIWPQNLHFFETADFIEI
jgi:hypothetical protein